MMRFLSDAWLARAWVLLEDDRAAAVRLSGRVQFRCAQRRAEVGWGFVVEGGRLVAVEREVVGPDVVVLQSYDDARKIFFGEIDGSEALRRTRIEARDHTGPAPPDDLGAQVGLNALPRLIGATIVVQYEFSNGPFGHVSHWIEFVDGRVTGMAIGRCHGPDVTVTVPYFAMALVRCGEMSILEALALGEVTGSLGPMGALAGIVESPEFQQAEQATGRSAVALAAMSEVAATPWFGCAWARLANETDTSR